MAEKMEFDLTDEEYNEFLKCEKVFKFFSKVIGDIKIEREDFKHLILVLGISAFRVVIDQINPSEETIEELKTKIGLEKKISKKEINEKMSPSVRTFLEEIERKMK